MVPSMIDWVNRHASEIIVAILTAVLVRLIDLALTKRSKVFYFFTNAAQFNIPVPNQAGVTANTLTLALWNNGRAVAEKVRIVHYRLPNHYQVWPPLATTVNTLPSAHVELELPQILPNQIVFVAYHDFLPLTAAQTIARIEARDHEAIPMTFQFQRVFPKWVNYTLQVLVVLGLVVVIRFAYVAGLALLRLLH